VERAALRNWKNCSEVLCDKKLPVKLKRKIYKAVVRPTMCMGKDLGNDERTRINE